MDEQKKLESNIWKYFLFVLTNRRNYIPILSIYFLTLPNATANAIGLYTGIGWIAGFLIEIHSGYISDTFGHKKTLIVAKISLLLSTLLFVIGDSLTYFIFGSIFIAVGFAFTSGTQNAFLHNTLIELKREKDYSKLVGKIGANASIVSAIMIMLLPLLSKVSIVMPIKIYLIFDIIGIVTAFSFINSKVEIEARDEEGEKIFSQIKKFWGSGFYITSLFFGIIGGLIMSTSPFRSPLIQSLGVPIIFIGSIMALSRVVWFFVGHNLHILKKIEIRKLIFFEFLFFSTLIILSAIIENYYIVILLWSLISGIFMGISPLISEYYLDNFLINKKYKATMLSIKSQISKMMESLFTFGVGYAMTVSFKFGFLLVGILMLILPLISYIFVRKSWNKH